MMRDVVHRMVVPFRAWALVIAGQCASQALAVSYSADACQRVDRRCPAHRYSCVAEGTECQRHVAARSES